MDMNRKILCGEEISVSEKREVVTVLLGAVCSEERRIQYKKGMHTNPDTDNMYPNFYISPYNGGKKLRLIQGYLPKTYILYANHYELEILRLLYLFAPDNEIVCDMVEATLQRLKGACFGNSCIQGECLAAGISVLRFLTVVCPNETEWIDNLLTPLGEVFLSLGIGQAVRRDVPVTYLLMALTDIGNEKACKLIRHNRDWLQNYSGRLSYNKSPEGELYNRLGNAIIEKALGLIEEDEEDR